MDIGKPQRVIEVAALETSVEELEPAHEPVAVDTAPIESASGEPAATPGMPSGDPEPVTARQQR